MFTHLMNLALADSADGSQDVNIDLLIGADFAHLFYLDHVVCGELGVGPVATLSRFGYVLSGPVPLVNHVSSHITVAHVLKTQTVVVNNDIEVFEAVKTVWDNENVVESVRNPQNPWKDKIIHNGKRYEGSLPVKGDHPIIPDTYTVACKRFDSLQTCLLTKPEVFEKYNAVSKEQLNANIVERVYEKTESPPGKMHYIPHREVVRDNRQTTKLHVVYDASSKIKGEVSLNECLDPGPNLAPLSFNILIRFRAKKVALIGDIEKAFLNVSINPTQRDLLRVLWVDSDNPADSNVVTYRFNRLVFGLTSSPYILNATIHHHLNSYRENYPEFVKLVLNNLYVDDYACSFDTKEESFEHFQKLKLCFLAGGFKLRKWASNCKSLLEDIDSYERSLDANSQSHPICKDDKLKVLGLIWNKQEDTMQFDFSTLKESLKQKAQNELTKRAVMQISAQVYDPLGLLAPVIIPMKCIFQTVCKQTVGWDSILSPELSIEWNKILIDLSNVSTLQFPRFMLPDIELESKSVDIHGFSDASQKAYGACVYVRIEHDKGIDTQLLGAKSRLAPLKGQTIPRMEVMAAALLAQFITTLYRGEGDSV